MSIQQIDVEHARLHAEQAGRGETVAMLHGFLVDSGQWDHEFAALSRDRHVLRYDARGFGRSTIEPGAYAHHEDLAAVLDACGVQRAALLACSGGAATALDFALAYPERVSAMVFVGAGYWGQFAHATPAARAFLQALGSYDVAGMIDSSLRAFTDGPRRLPQDVDAAVRHRTREMTANNFRRASNYWRRAADDQRAPQPSVLDRLHEIAAPTLLISGTEDQPEAIALSERMAAGIPTAQFLLLQGAGHHTNMEAPDAVLAETRRWLAKYAV
ncbi:alpha/beta fold hydrolase [Rhodanobacter sp. DHG33]|uniref:alpha/beta fold hydrolase n=1 Tax=Rhodanobacter sp. DHG33 TaxID=2775921 RepID=UPI00177EE567|nr:alpha/beta fold hydrolase [Rhodanobacter sp. DHG33]MBD8899852.1 alpha/beta fold hydrolase [Rhodanobacter sp. DHG33]